MSKLAEIQEAVKAPKNKNNNFGKYKYRNFEDICEAVKPVLAKYDADLTVSDSVENIGTRFYIVATATLAVDGKTYQAKGYAREGESKTGMDVAQLTGACSSYARKYALCALFLIDGSEDFDEMDNREEGKAKPATAKAQDADARPAQHAAQAQEEPDSDTRNFLVAMKKLAAKNRQEYLDALGNMGYEGAADIPVERRREIYKVIYDAVYGATK
ncbi:MAG: ERF family protein [Fibrobacter sp.]|nr:ERF family protein [Fibrobacter sp.]